MPRRQPVIVPAQFKLAPELVALAAVSFSDLMIMDFRLDVFASASACLGFGVALVVKVASRIGGPC